MAALRSIEAPVEIPDGELIQRTLGGDQGAFTVIVERYQKRIFRVANAIVRSEMEADLITQDTFVQAYINLTQFEGRSGLETWLTRIAINRSRDVLRSRRWHSLVPLDGGERDGAGTEIVDEEPDAERRAISREIHDAVERAVESLSVQQKTIFRLRHFESLGLDQIAELLGLRPGTVRAHLFRAVRKVRRELRDWMPGKAEGAIQ